ncbi:hypothetical protein [Croceicoccus sp. Ery15]|uniref:hypothetical protein n=1 Tax=Croceicoccus sp. Ery15 TaxID=1703338 RepID=UPI001E2B7FDD|nr:hypothetical protein [Croceicoccus sp. Ery15]
MKRALVLCALLAGCGGEEGGIRIERVEVPVEVQKPCPAERPLRPGPLGALNPDTLKALAQTLAKLAEYSDDGQYADQAESVFDICEVQ